MIGDRVVLVDMRRGNEADFLVAGELVAGGYPLPRSPFRPPTAIVDGGANIGTFSLQAAARFPHVPITCYEPEVSNVAQLRLNFTNNGTKAEIVSKALWSTSANLFFHPGLSYSGFVSASPSPYPISCELPEVPDGCWLKLDIEGAEYEVLPAILRQRAKPSIISMEIHDFANRGAGLLNVLKQNGYVIEGEIAPHAPCVNVCAYRRSS
jgi:FkbM family methyltransferase